MFPKENSVQPFSLKSGFRGLISLETFSKHEPSLEVIIHIHKLKDLKSTEVRKPV